MFHKRLLATAITTMVLLSTAAYAQETTILGPDAALFTGHVYVPGENRFLDGCQVTLYGTPQYTPIDVYVAEGDEIISIHRPKAFVLSCLDGNPKMELRHILKS